MLAVGYNVYRIYRSFTWTHKKNPHRLLYPNYFLLEMIAERRFQLKYSF